MAWKETCVLDEKLRFVVAHLSGDFTMTELCATFGISRQTGYDLVRRHRAEGAAGLAPRSRAPHRPGNAMAGEIAAAIVALREAHPFWGPKKLWAKLLQRAPQETWPAARRSAICCGARVWSGRGRVGGRRQRRRGRSRR